MDNSSLQERLDNALLNLQNFDEIDPNPYEECENETEPLMKDEFPAFLNENNSEVYQKQYNLIKNIIETYDDKGLDEDTQNKHVFSLFQDLQELGPLPSKLVGNETVIPI